MVKKKPEPEPEIPEPEPEEEPLPEQEEPKCYGCNELILYDQSMLITGTIKPETDIHTLRKFHKNCAIHAYARNGWGALFG